MDDVIARIKGFVTTLYPTILTDLSISNEYLEFIVGDVVDRALVYMNRDQLVYQYEKDLVSYSQDNSAYDLFWAEYEYPIPPRLEKTLAKVVVGAVKTVKEHNTAELGAVKSVSDNGQSVTFADQLTNFFSSSNESEVFSGSLELLDRYMLPTVLKDDNYR